jgi:PadR family transcriptional regulator PadR
MVMGRKPDKDEIERGIASELRRGLSVVVILSRLGREQYGYTLLKELEAAGLPVDQNTLYPLLRRLEAQGLLASQWKVEEQRPRRYYARTTLGTTVLHDLRAELASHQRLLEEVRDDTE